MNNTRQFGLEGEAKAASYLAGHGYMLLARNYRAHRFEIDIVMGMGDTLIFVEVKSRASDAFGLGREAVDLAKQRNIIKAAEHYIHANKLEDMAVRFDVVEVDPSGRITHIEDAFRP